jgi:hypothetical protein
VSHFDHTKIEEFVGSTTPAHQSIGRNYTIYKINTSFNHIEKGVVKIEIIKAKRKIKYSQL